MMKISDIQYKENSASSTKQYYMGQGEVMPLPFAIPDLKNNTASVTTNSDVSADDLQSSTIINSLSSDSAWLKYSMYDRQIVNSSILVAMPLANNVNWSTSESDVIDISVRKALKQIKQLLRSSPYHLYNSLLVIKLPLLDSMAIKLTIKDQCLIAIEVFTSNKDLLPLLRDKNYNKLLSQDLAYHYEQDILPLISCNLQTTGDHGSSPVKYIDSSISISNKPSTNIINIVI